MNAKNPVSRKTYVSADGKTYNGRAAKAARNRDGNAAAWNRFASVYNTRQRPGSMKSH